MTSTFRPENVQALSPGQWDTARWSDVQQKLASASSYWLATAHPDGRPHVIPVLAVGLDGLMHFCTNATSRKGQNLQEKSHCVITAKAGGYDLVLNGIAERVMDETEVERIADAYDEKYGWRVTARDGAFHDTEGAPTAGPPPYDVYRILPNTAFAFGTEEHTMGLSTRWQFS